jgi:hypothetical protein
MAQYEVLGACRRADRVGLDETQPVESAFRRPYRESSMLENTLTFATPIFSVEDIPRLQELREIIGQSRTSQQDMLAVLAGVDDPGVAIRAANSTINIFVLNRLIEQLADDVGLVTVSDHLHNAYALEEIDGRISLRKLTEDLVGLLSESHRADTQWAARDPKLTH